MNNENTTTATAASTPVAPQDTPREKIIDETVQKLQLDDATAAAVRQILEPVDSGLNSNLVTLIATAIRHDDDVKNAETARYLRGRNEKIEILNRIDDTDAETTPVNFPQYHKRSFWDDMKG